MSIDRRKAFHDIANRRPSEVPYLVGAWQHLVGHEYGSETFARAYVDFVKRWDWEWVKINPRAVYYAEAWGSQYDPDDYPGVVLPRQLKPGIAKPEDVESIGRLDPKGNNAIGENYRAAALIREELKDRAVLQTVFSPLSVYLQIADLPLYPGDPVAKPIVTRDQIIKDQPQNAKRALNNIALTLADYAVALVTPVEQGGAGLDGIFFAETGIVSEGFFSREEYLEFSEPYDRIVIDAVRKANPDAVVLLHTCRKDSHPDWFVGSGAQIIQWDQYIGGNPSIDADLDTVPVGGASQNDFETDADPEVVRREIQDTIDRRKGRPFLLAPSCTVPTPANEESLRILSEARVA